MNNIASIMYDPSTAATAATTAARAMSALDTTNLRHTFTVPASGKVRVRMEFTIHGGATNPQILCGVMSGSTVVARVAPRHNTSNLATSTLNRCIADFIVTGLTPGASLTWDAASGVETAVGSTAIKWGGPDDTTANNAFGAFCFELYDPSPFPTFPTNFSSLSIDGNGRVDVIKVAGTTQTARDMGASVLVAAGTGAGQLDFTSGRLNVNVTHADNIAWNSGALTGTAIGSGFVSAITTDLATASALYTVQTGINDILQDTGTDIPTSLNIIAGYLDTEISTLVTIAGRLDSAMEADGMVYRFTANALEEAPSSGGGGTDWTPDEKATIKAVLGIPASGTMPDDPTTGILDTIRDAITTVDANVDLVLEDTSEIGTAGAGLTALAPASTALSTATWTLTRAAYLDKLNITGNVAASAEVVSIQNNTRMVLTVPEQIKRPPSGTETLYVRLYLYDELNNMEAPDSAPTMEIRNAAGTDLSSRLTSTTGTLESTGRYRWEYTSSSAHAAEQLLWEASVIEGGSPRQIGRLSWVADTYSVDFTSSDRTLLNTIADYVDSIPTDVWAAGSRTLTGIVDANVVEWDGDAEVIKTDPIYSVPLVSITAYRSPDTEASASVRLDSGGSNYPLVCTKALEDIGGNNINIRSDVGGATWWINDIRGIHGTEIPYTEGQTQRIALAFAKQYDVATPVFTSASVNQTGDSFARIGANGAGLTAIATQVDTTLTASHGAGGWNTATGFSTLTEANVRNAIGMSTANMDVQLAGLGTDLDDVLERTDRIPDSPAAVGSLMTLSEAQQNAIASALLNLTDGVETNVTVKTALRVFGAVLGGLLSGAGTDTITLKALNNGGTTRLTVTTDEDGNRTSVVLS